MRAGASESIGKGRSGETRHAGTDTLTRHSIDTLTLGVAYVGVARVLTGGLQTRRRTSRRVARSTTPSRPATVDSRASCTDSIPSRPSPPSKAPGGGRCASWTPAAPGSSAATAVPKASTPKVAELGISLPRTLSYNGGPGAPRAVAPTRGSNRRRPRRRVGSRRRPSARALRSADRAIILPFRAQREAAQRSGRRSACRHEEGREPTGGVKPNWRRQRRLRRRRQRRPRQMWRRRRWRRRRRQWRPGSWRRRRGRRRRRRGRR